MELSRKSREALPYLIVLGIAVWFFYVASHIAYTSIPNQMGPDRWPKMISATLAVISAFEVLRRLLTPAPAETKINEEALEDHLVHPTQTHVPEVMGAVGATIVYLLMLDHTGFAASTLIYSACLMWLGGFRRPGIIALCACGLTILFCFIFMKLIFVALPLGQGPFEKISLALMSFVGVH